MRLGDDIDDFCVKCKRITNHAVVSLVEDAAAKVRCNACYSEHDYRREIAPPTKRELKKIADAAKAAELAELEPAENTVDAGDSAEASEA
jgi:hypothetical protein